MEPNAFPSTPNASSQTSDHSAHNAAEIIPELLTTKQAAELLACGKRTLTRWVEEGAAPAPVKIRGSVRFRRAELQAWIADGCPRLDEGAEQ